MHKPQRIYKQRFCPECGHTDRIRALGDRHFAYGKLCKGKPITVTYKLMLEAELCSKCGAIHGPKMNTLCDR